MPESYSESTRKEARRLWLRGRMTDAEIAERVGVRRPGTITDWRAKEDWESSRREINEFVETEIADRQKQKIDALDQKHDQVGEALESLVIRHMRARNPDGSPEADPAAVRALAGALAQIQKVRRTALGADKPLNTVAAMPPISITYVERGKDDDDPSKPVDESA